MLGQVSCKYFARRLTNIANDDTPGLKLEQTFHKGVLLIHEQDVIIRQTWQPLVHQRTDIVHTTHLFWKQNQGSRSF